MHFSSTLQQIQADFQTKAVYYNVRKEILEAKINRKQTRLNQLKNELDGLKTIAPEWTADLLRPVLEAIKPHFSGWLCDDEKLLPQGDAQRVPVFFIRRHLLGNLDPNEPVNSIILLIVPGDLSHGELLYETDEPREKSSIESNQSPAFQHKLKPLESIEEVVLFLQSKIAAANQTAKPR